MRRLLALAILAIASPAAADSDEIKRGSDVTSLAHIEATGLLRDGDLRAIIGYTNGQVSGYWLVVEKLGGGRIEWQYLLRNATWKGSSLAIREARGLTLDSFHRRVLTFNLQNGGDWLRCTVDTRATAPAATCGGGSGGGTGSGAPPQPQPPSEGKTHNPTMAEIEAVTAACSNVFPYDTARTKTCVGHEETALRGPFWQVAVKIPQQCSSAFPYDTTNTMACIEAAKTTKRDVAEVIAYCTKNNPYNTAGTKTCLLEWFAKP